MSDDSTRSPTSTVWFLLTLVAGFLLVTGSTVGWVLPPALTAVAFALFFFLFIRSGARARGR